MTNENLLIVSDTESIHSVVINGMEVKAHFIDNKDGFRWRLESGEEVSEWYAYYSGLLTHKFKNGRTFGLSSQYYEGTLPTEIPFEIIIPI